MSDFIDSSHKKEPQLLRNNEKLQDNKHGVSHKF